MGPEAIISLICGLLGGFVLSFVFWYFLNKEIIPRLYFSEYLSRKPSEFHRCGERVQLRIKNKGLRAAFDVRVRVKIVVPDILKRGSKAKNSYGLAMETKSIFRIKRGSLRSLEIVLNESDCFLKPVFSKLINDKRTEQKLVIDDLFSEYPGCYFEAQILAVDSFSSAFTCIESGRYSLDKIWDGEFKWSSLEIVKETP